MIWGKIWWAGQAALLCWGGKKPCFNSRCYNSGHLCQMFFPLWHFRTLQQNSVLPVWPSRVNSWCSSHVNVRARAPGSVLLLSWGITFGLSGQQLCSWIVARDSNLIPDIKVCVCVLMATVAEPFNHIRSFTHFTDGTILATTKKRSMQIPVIVHMKLVIIWQETTWYCTFIQPWVGVTPKQSWFNHYSLQLSNKVVHLRTEVQKPLKWQYSCTCGCGSLYHLFKSAQRDTQLIPSVIPSFNFYYMLTDKDHTVVHPSVTPENPLKRRAAHLIQF